LPSWRKSEGEDAGQKRRRRRKGLKDWPDPRVWMPMREWRLQRRYEQRVVVSWDSITDAVGPAPVSAHFFRGSHIGRGISGAATPKMVRDFAEECTAPEAEGGGDSGGHQRLEGIRLRSRAGNGREPRVRMSGAGRAMDSRSAFLGVEVSNYGQDRDAIHSTCASMRSAGKILEERLDKIVCGGEGLRVPRVISRVRCG